MVNGIGLSVPVYGVGIFPELGLKRMRPQLIGAESKYLFAKHNRRNNPGTFDWGYLLSDMA